MASLLPPVAIAVSVAVLAVASLNDIAARILPNWASLALAVIGIVLRAADLSLLRSVAIAALVFVLAMQCWRRGWLGGGDVKLLAACTLLVPPGQVFALLLATAIAGGALALCYLLLAWFEPGGGGTSDLTRPAGRFARIRRIECWRIRRRGSLPYGCAIATAATFMLTAPAGFFVN